MKTGLALAAALAMVSLPAAAAPYTLFIYEADQQLALRAATGEDSAHYWEAYDSFGKQLAEAGVLRGGSALRTGAPLSLVSSAGPSGASAPYAVSPLALGGYFQIDVATDADAITWAQKMPTAGGGLVEVRQGYPVPGKAM